MPSRPKSLTSNSLRLRVNRVPRLNFSHLSYVDNQLTLAYITPSRYISEDLLMIILQYLHPVPYYSLLSLVNKQWSEWISEAWKQVRTINFSYVCYNKDPLMSRYRYQQLKLFKQLHPQLVKRLSGKERLEYKSMSTIHQIHASKTYNHLFNAFVVFIVNQVLLQANGYHSALDSSMTKELKEDSTSPTGTEQYEHYLDKLFLPNCTIIMNDTDTRPMTSPLETLTFSDIIFTKDLSRVIRYLCPNLKTLNIIMCHVPYTNGLIDFPNLITLNLCGSQVNDDEFGVTTMHNRWTELLTSSCNAASEVVMLHDGLALEPRRTIPKKVPRKWRDLFTPEATTCNLRAIDLRFTSPLSISSLSDRFFTTSPDYSYEMPTNILRHRIHVQLPSSKDSMLDIFTQYGIDGNTPTVIEYLTPKQPSHMCSTLTLIDMDMLKAYTRLGYSMRTKLADGNTALHYLLANIKANMHLLHNGINRKKIKDYILYMLRLGADVQCKNHNHVSCIQIAKQIDDNLRVLEFLGENRPTTRATFSHVYMEECSSSTPRTHNSFKMMREKNFTRNQKHVAKPARKRGNTILDLNYNGEIFWTNQRERQRAVMIHANVNPVMSEFSTKLNGDVGGKVFEALLIANAVGYKVDREPEVMIPIISARGKPKQNNQL
jgi:hypothetical protein